MCKHVEKPLVFPLSNPTSQAEITAENAYKYSKGKCIFAGGKHADIQLVTPCTCTAARGRYMLLFVMVFLCTHDTVWQQQQFERVCHSFGPLLLANRSEYLSLRQSAELVVKGSAINLSAQTARLCQSSLLSTAVQQTIQHLHHHGARVA